jgi:hypothetical protein
MDEDYPANTINSNDYAITSLWSNTSSSEDLPSSSTKCLVFTLLKDSVMAIQFEKNTRGESEISLNAITAYEWINYCDV